MTYSYDRRAATACGLCFPWAYRQVRESGGTLVHATVSFWGKSFEHAWVEKGGKVYDWQTMVQGMSNYARKGWPLDEFYETYSPTRIKRYNRNQAMMTMMKSRGGRLQGDQHFGPWH